MVLLSSQQLIINFENSQFSHGSDAKQSQFHCQEENKVSNDNTHDEWVSGEYQTADGDIIDGSTMNHFMSAVGESSTRPIMHSQTSSNSPLVSDSTELKKGFGRFTANKEVGFGFGEKHGMAETIERKFRKEMKTVLSNRQGYYHPEIDKHVANTDFSKLRLGEKYNVFFGGDFKASIDHHLLDSVLKYIADSPVFGSILVFLPGYDDIQEIMYRIDQWRGSLTNYRNTLVIPLHSQMHSIDHSEIFKPVAQDTRKIILATNIAEASITIEDVIFVVDTGKVKEKAYNYEAKLSTLTVSPISKSNAKQRSGRAGRVSNGYCIRLYSEQEFESMPETQVAEMKRVAIYDVTLHAKLFAPRGTRVVDFLSLAPEPPSVEAISQSIAFLEQVGAFYSPSRRSDADDEDIEPELTDLGRLMARLPLDPQLSRMLLFGLALKCLTPIVNLVAMLANRDPCE
uniref:Helicase C-terminal domain-containing protein n=1 Tax=Caenorhabditis japonica TaxID=281687 RepID=A0A8R1I967_CAEJA